MSPTDLFALVTAIATLATAVAAGATYYLFRRQTKTMEAQLALAREQIQDLQNSRSRQQLYQVTASLLDMRSDVETVLSLRGKDTDIWSEDELRAAHTVASRFHLVGVLVIDKLVPEDLLARVWFYSIPHCHEVLKPFIAQVRLQRDPRYWEAFDVLAARVREHSNQFRGFRASNDA